MNINNINKVYPDIPVKEIMNTQLITIHPKEKLARAKEIFETHDIHHLPVTVMGKLHGIISQGDLLFLEGLVTTSFDEFLRIQKFKSTSVDEIMTIRPIAASQYMSLSEVLKLMLDNKINCIPIIENNQLVGLVTSRDFLRVFSIMLKSSNDEQPV